MNRASAALAAVLAVILSLSGCAARAERFKTPERKRGTIAVSDREAAESAYGIAEAMLESSETGETAGLRSMFSDASAAEDADLDAELEALASVLKGAESYEGIVVESMGNEYGIVEKTEEIELNFRRSDGRIVKMSVLNFSRCDADPSQEGVRSINYLEADGTDEGYLFFEENADPGIRRVSESETQ